MFHLHAIEENRVMPHNFQFVSQKMRYIKLQGYGGKSSAQRMWNDSTFVAIYHYL